MQVKRVNKSNLEQEMDEFEEDAQKIKYLFKAVMASST